MLLRVKRKSSERLPAVLAVDIFEKQNEEEADSDERKSDSSKGSANASKKRKLRCFRLVESFSNDEDCANAVSSLKKGGDVAVLDVATKEAVAEDAAEETDMCDVSTGTRYTYDMYETVSDGSDDGEEVRLEAVVDVDKGSIDFCYIFEDEQAASDSEREGTLQFSD
eukprot:GHVU01112449.1.p1 GENE.GHVU01112449.1~~GHVU01112449.1.p1  ORF type:complete len:167 (+),score=34.93 GHVU01112449.1:805-1305(+)